jgi:plasmid stabilization system protein ParE
VIWRVRFTRAAQDDLVRLFDFIIDRELGRDGGDIDTAERALSAIRSGIRTLETSPFTCRKAANSPFLRELVIPFGASGYVALFEIVKVHEVVIAAIRHQREDDFH